MKRTPGALWQGGETGQSWGKDRPGTGDEMAKNDREISIDFSTLTR